MHITVYCGASLGNQPEYQQATIAMGQWIAQKQHTLVYGGGKIGLMGLLADTVLAHGGKVIGIMPAFLQAREPLYQRMVETGFLSEDAFKKLLFTEDFAEIEQFIAGYQPPEFRHY